MNQCDKSFLGGTSESLIPISVGIENIDDRIADLEEGLRRSNGMLYLFVMLSEGEASVPMGRTEILRLAQDDIEIKNNSSQEQQQ